VAVPEADYVDVGEWLSVQAGRDYTFLHPEVLEERCLLREGQLMLPNRVHPGRFSVLILPGHETIRWSSLEKIKAFYEQGGAVIATGQLPSKSAEFGHDADVLQAVAAMFGPVGPEADAAPRFALRISPRGGRAMRLRTRSADGLREALDAARPPYDVSFEPGRALRYIHKTWNGRHIYFFANLDPTLTESAVTLRGRHDLEAWDPHTGRSEPLHATHSRKSGIELTHVRLALPHLKSVFVVTARP
jgi:hypothetical protein